MLKLILLIILSLSACTFNVTKSTVRYANDDQVPCTASPADRRFKLATSRAATYGYNWEQADWLLTPKDARYFITETIKRVDPAVINRRVNMGEGLYIAPNPFVSSDFGDTLMVIPFTEGCEFGVTRLDIITDGRDSYEMMKSLLPGVIYPWRETLAMVARNSRALDIDNVTVVPQSRVESRLLDMEPFKLKENSTWFEAASHYMAYYQQLTRDIPNAAKLAQLSHFTQNNDVTLFGIQTLIDHELKAFSRMTSTLPAFLDSTQLSNICNLVNLKTCLQDLADDLESNTFQKHLERNNALLKEFNYLEANAPLVGDRDIVLFQVKQHLSQNNKIENALLFLRSLQLFKDVFKIPSFPTWNP